MPSNTDPTANYNTDFSEAEALTRAQYGEADPRTVRATIRRCRASMVWSPRNGTADGTLVTLLNIAAERGIDL